MAQRILGMRWRTVLIGLVVLVVVGGGMTAVLALRSYDELTQIDRSDPYVVTDRYLDAAVVRRDSVGAALYTCSEPSLGPVYELLAELDQRKREFEVDVLVSWGALASSDDGEQKFARTALTIAGTKDGIVTSERSEQWRFTLVDEDGWRVCGAERLPDAASTPSPAS